MIKGIKKIRGIRGLDIKKVWNYSVYKPEKKGPWIIRLNLRGGDCVDWILPWFIKKSLEDHEHWARKRAFSDLRRLIEVKSEE